MDARTSRTGLAAAMALLATACGGGNRESGRLAVSARTVAPAGAATATAAPSGLDLGDGIVLTRVRLAVQRIQLEGSPASADATVPAPVAAKDDGSGSGAGGGSDDPAGSEDDVSVGPFAVDLGADALAGGIHSVLDADVPAGTYRELRIAVGPVADAAAGSAAAAMSGRSVVVDGTIGGSPFTFESSLASVQKVELTIQVAADGSSSGVTLTVDPHGWFRAADGSRLDPTMEANRAAIEARVQASIGAELEDHGGGADDPANHG